MVENYKNHEKTILRFSNCNFTIFGLKKEDTKKPGQLDSNQLSSVTSSASTMSIELQTFMQSALTQAMLSGKTIGDYPDIPASSKSGASALLKGVFFKSGGNNWSVPDAEGLYSMSYTGLYTYTYKVRYKDSTITCITSFNYSGMRSCRTFSDT